MTNVTLVQKEAFEKALGELKQKLVSFHDEKVRREDLINQEYLEYLSLKYTSRSFADICKHCDAEAIRTILSKL